MINHPQKKHYPIRATKVELLKYIKKREIVTASDLVEHFRYTPESAKRKLRGLRQQGLLTSWVSQEQWCLTQIGRKEVSVFRQKSGAGKYPMIRSRDISELSRCVNICPIPN